MAPQRNKPHKPGRKAGKSAREKHRLAKSSARRSVVSSAGATTQGKAERFNTAKQIRDNKRDVLLAKKRQIGSPRVVAMLPMCEAVDIERFWNDFLGACEDTSAPAEREADGNISDATANKVYPMRPTLVALPGNQKGQMYCTPPTRHRSKVMSMVELARHAEAVLLIFANKGEIDSEAAQALAILREFGIPSLFPVVWPPSNAPLNVRAASKKLAASSLDLQGLVDQKVHLAGSSTDFQQLLRHIGDTSLKIPSWRQQRPALLAESAHFETDQADASTGTLILRGFVRCLGLSANQLLHIPGAGDFQIKRIEGPARPQPEVSRNSNPVRVADKEMEEVQHPVLASSDPEKQESLVREIVPDPLDAEQTWPTEEELADAAMEVEGRKRKLPKGTSEYQAAWILDDEFSDEDVEEVHMSSPKTAAASAALSTKGIEDWDVGMDEDQDDEASVAPTEADRRAPNSKKPSLAAQSEDFQFPDEMDTPEDVSARLRFAKYRGLKSWRTSPWDPKESLPKDYARIFAFQSIKRAEKRAKRAAALVGSSQDPAGVPVGTFADVHVASVPAEAAALLVQQVDAANKGEEQPLVAFGLLQHETRLSVLNFCVKKAADNPEPLRGKAELLFVAGFRTFSARPIFSADDHGAKKFKMERFLQPGQTAVASVYAPIMYPPCPLLAFQRTENGDPCLAASGTLRSCDPDRIILKRIVLSGYPVRVHKKKAVVRWMFHNPEDIRWFRPLELWTKHGLRGRIKEPVGTHGAMKCMFDGAVKQQDAVCTSLYKRVFPKWPESMDFAFRPERQFATNLTEALQPMEASAPS